MSFLKPIMLPVLPWAVKYAAVMCVRRKTRLEDIFHSLYTMLPTHNHPRGALHTEEEDFMFVPCSHTGCYVFTACIVYIFSQVQLPKNRWTTSLINVIPALCFSILIKTVLLSIFHSVYRLLYSVKAYSAVPMWKIIKDEVSSKLCIVSTISSFGHCACYLNKNTNRNTLFIIGFPLHYIFFKCQHPTMLNAVAQHWCYHIMAAILAVVRELPWTQPQ